MEIPENTLKEIKLSFSSKTAYEKDSVDAYIQELMMQIEDAKRSADAKRKEASEYKKKLKEVEEARMLEGDHTDTINNLKSKLEKANSDLSSAKEKLTEMESRALEAEHQLQEANAKVSDLTEECEKYDKALARMQSGDGGAVMADDDESAELIADMKEELQEKEETIDKFERELAETKEELADALADVKRLKREASAAVNSSDDAAVNEKLESYQNEIDALQASVDSLTKEKDAAAEELADVRKELDNAKKHISELESSSGGETKSSSNINLDVSDLIEETQKYANSFLNAAKEKASALTAETEKNAAKIISEANEAAKKIKEQAKQDAASLLDKTNSDLSSMDDLLASIRNAIIEKLDEASAIAAESADKLARSAEKNAKTDEDNSEKDTEQKED